MWASSNNKESENLNLLFRKVYSCEVRDGVIVVEGSLAGVSRAPVMKHRLTVAILEDGTMDICLEGQIRRNAPWLPRLGFDWLLPKTASDFTYYGHGPIESYCDMCHYAPVGLYSSTAEEEYVPYVRPQEHGNHNGVRMLRIGKLEFTAETPFECNVSNYSVDALFRAGHTDELVEDGMVHLRIDYRMSGIGSNSCGPELARKCRLEEKEVSFRFSVRPCSGESFPK